MFYHAVGSALITDEEYMEKYSEIADFYGALKSGAPPAGSVELSNGCLTAENSIDFNVNPDVPSDVAFTEIGIGKPLTVRIMEVYPGKYPISTSKKGKDMLLATSIRDTSLSTATPYALNYMQKNVAPYKLTGPPSPVTSGTPYIYYSPAIIPHSLSLECIIAFDTFNEDDYSQFGGLLQSAASIPVFLCASAFLFAAGTVVKLLGNLGESMRDGKPALLDRRELKINIAGNQPLQPGFMMIAGQDADIIDPSFSKNYGVNKNGEVRTKHGDPGIPYSGDAPYIVLSFDGAVRDTDLGDFIPTAVSGAVLEKFLHIKNEETRHNDDLLQAFKDFSDMRWFRKIKTIKNELRDNPAYSSDIVNAKNDEIDRYKKNILNDMLKQLL